MKNLYTTRKEADEAMRNIGSWYYESTADAEKLEVVDPELQRRSPSGEVRCYRNGEGDIAAWWE